MMPPEDMMMMQQPPQGGQPPMGGEDPFAGMDQLMQQGGMDNEMVEGMQPSSEEVYEPESDLATSDIETLILNTNLAKKLRKKKDKNGDPVLEKIARVVLEGIKLDEQSRQDWLAQNEESFKLAMLIRENKTYPWPEASNIKYPLIATAAMQFSARAYPALVPSDGTVVKARAIPSAIQSAYLDSATKIARHMSWQLMVKNTAWEPEMDKLLMTLSVVGSMFKKTYYDVNKNQNCSYIIYPKDFIIDYHATSIGGAYRKTEVIRYTENEIKERVRNDEEFLDVEYGEPVLEEEEQERLENKDSAPSINKATPHTFYQCHTYYDLDEDGYEEPVVVTIHKATEQVVNVVVRFTSESIQANANGEIIRIEPLEYYTGFTFIENPVGSLYGMGFGILLGPINEAINTIINLLVDSGKINNLQSGFISKTLRLNMAATPFKPGEWKLANASGDELKNGIVPLPTKEPSNVLMQLVQMLIQSGMQLASVAEIMVGKMPGQNTPATTTQQTVEQSMAVFTAVYKRVYRSLAEEYRKLMFLNKINPTLVMQEAQESGIDIQPQDYQLYEYSIIPGADPTGDSQVIKQQKFMWVAQMIMPLGTIDPMAMTQWGLEFMEIPNWQKLLPQQPPQPAPDPKMMEAQAKIQLMQETGAMKKEAHAQDLEHKQALASLKYAEAEQKNQAFREKTMLEAQNQLTKNKIDAVSRVNQARATQRAMNIKTEAARQEALAKLVENRAMHRQKMEHQRETQRSKKQTSKE